MGKPGTGLSRSADCPADAGTAHRGPGGDHKRQSCRGNVARLVKPPEHTRGSMTPEQGRGQESWPRWPLTGSTSHGGYRFMACAEARCSACDGRISICTPGRMNQARVLVDYRVRIEEPKSRNGKRNSRSMPDWWSCADRAAQAASWRKARSAGMAYGSGVARVDRYQGGEDAITNAAGAPSFTPSGIPTSSADCSGGPGCGGSPCTIGTLHDPDADGVRGRADPNHQQVGGPRDGLGVHAEDLRPCKRGRSATGPGCARQDSQYR